MIIRQTPSQRGPFCALIDNQYKAGKDQSTNLDSFRKIVRQTYKQRTLLHSDTAAAKFIDGLRESVGKVEAAAALATFLGQSVNHADFRQFRGSVEIANFLGGVTEGTAAAERQSFGQLADKYRGRLAEDTGAADALRDRLEELVGDHEDIQQRGAKNMATAVKRARQEAADQREAADKLLMELEKLYNTKLALDAPMTYWTSKRDKHLALTRKFFGGFAAYVVAATGLSFYYLHGTTLADPAYWKDASLGVVGLTLAALGVVVAIARVLLRLAMSQLHLGNDADERVTMVNTYLALRQGEHANEQHMGIVLERLFAPATDGMVKDELGPITIADGIKAAAMKK